MELNRIQNLPPRHVLEHVAWDLHHEVAMLKRELEQPSCSLRVHPDRVRQLAERHQHCLEYLQWLDTIIDEIERREHRTRIVLMDDDVTD